MKDIRRNRILVWAMYFIVFFCMGQFALICWTVYQLCKCSEEEKEYEEKQIPIRERSGIIKLNKEENLTEEERRLLRANPEFVKIGKGVYLLEDK